MPGGEIGRLGGIGAQVVELPIRLGERGLARPPRHDLPSVRVETEVALQLVVLLVMQLGGRPVAQQWQQRDTVHRLQSSTIPLGRWAQTDDVEQCRQHVDAVPVLGPGRAGLPCEASGPVPDARHPVAAGVGVALVEPERRVRCHRPAARVVAHRPGRPDELQAGRIDLDVTDVGTESKVGVVVRRAAGLSLAAGPVVAEEHQHGVVPLAHHLERRPQLSDALVELVDHRRVHGHVASEDGLLRRGQLVPWRHVVAVLAVAVGENCSRRQQPEFDLALVAAAADLVPAGAVDALVAADVGGLGDEGRVGGAVGEVEEERLARVGRLALLHEGDRTVGEVVGEEVARRVARPVRRRGCRR